MRSCKYILGLFLVRIVVEKSVLLFNTCNLILLRDCNILQIIHSCRDDWLAISCVALYLHGSQNWSLICCQ